MKSILKTCGLLTGLLILSANVQAKTFKFRLLAEPQTFDWHLAATSVETPIMMNIMEGLTEVDDNLKPVPCLASKMDLSKDQRTYTFTIRKGVKWSDGVPLTAQHFVEGWERLLTPDTAAPYAYLLYDVVGASDFNQGKAKDFKAVGVKATDDQTFVVTLKQPVAYFPYLTGFWPLFPVRGDLVKKHGSKWSRPKTIVTLGAYTLEKYQPQTKITLKANPNYWRDRGNVNEVVAQIIKDSATALNVFRAGKIQVMQDFSPDDLKLARPMPEFQTFPYLKTHYLALRVKDSVTSNKDLRQAMVRAIDRSPIPAILNGSQSVANSFIPPKVVGHNGKLSVPFDVKKAKEYLKKSGIDPSTEIEFIARNSERPRILTQYIQSELKKNLGLNIKISLYDHKVFRSQISTQKIPLMLMVWAGDYPDGDSFLGLFESNTGNNFTHFSNAKYDDYMKKAREDWNTLKRDRLYKKAQEIVQLQEAAILPLYYEENEALVAKSVKGFEINPIGYFYIRKVSL